MAPTKSKSPLGSFSQAIKTKMRTLCDECWLCETKASPLQACHVIDRKDRLLLEPLLRARGLTNFSISDRTPQQRKRSRRLEFLYQHKSNKKLPSTETLK
ncbi:hypothetical protein V8E54_002717 [Elaphomyces granulatus]